MMKILQANVGMQNRPYQASPLPSELLNSGPTVQNLELLQRTEAQAIIQGGILISLIFNPSICGVYTLLLESFVRRIKWLLLYFF